MKRLAEGRQTVLSLSPTQRYLFRDDGVHWIPDISIHKVPDIDYYDHGALVLYELNTAQTTIEKCIGWPHVIVSSPKWSALYSEWESERPGLTVRFVMQPWTWKETYCI